MNEPLPRCEAKDDKGKCKNRFNLYRWLMPVFLPRLNGIVYTYSGLVCAKRERLHNECARSKSGLVLALRDRI